ncbi:MAG TPA: hypothetical protein ENK91_12435, partial [Bacteroidetes bacterium]|nr:hypothetical protein [Bacteroidota bacterium]
MLLFVFSSLGVNAFNFVSTEDFEDNCGNKIVVEVIRNINNVVYDCGKVKCELQINTIQGGQFIDEYDNIIWTSGTAYTEIYNLNEVAYFNFDNPGIYNIELDFDVVTFCGTFSFHYDNFIVVNGCDSEYCSSSFSYCDFFYVGVLPNGANPPPANEQMPILVDFRYTDPDYGNQIINSNNNYGIFTFPYYCHVTDDCGFHPNLFDFVNDLNVFLNLSNSGIPQTENLFGTTEFHYISQGYYCKRYIRTFNTGILITKLNFIHSNFDKPNCSTGTIFNANLYPAWITTDFPSSNSCLVPSGQNDQETENYFLNFEQEKKFNLEYRGQSNPINSIYCYPNIVSDNITIYNQGLLPLELFIYSGTGKFIKKLSSKELKKNIDVSKFPKG